MQTGDIAATSLENIMWVKHMGNWDDDYIIYYSNWYYIFQIKRGIINNYTEITGANLDCPGHTTTYGYPGNQA